MVGSVLVLLGGTSPEREVSLASGAVCADALREAGYRVSTFDMAEGVRPLLQEIDRIGPLTVFNALHGVCGEDGTVQGLLDLLEIPYTHSGILASSLAMDKPLARRIFDNGKLTVAEGRVVSVAELRKTDPIDRPFVIKPCNQGSSVAVHIVDRGDNNVSQLLADWRFGTMALVERYIAGRELTVAVLDGVALAITEIVPNTRFYDYTEKYDAEKGARHILPAELSPEIREMLCEMAERAHNLLGCRGISRADFRYDEENNGMYLLEVNTQPGMTVQSLVPEQAAYRGIELPALCARLIELARFGP